MRNGKQCSYDILYEIPAAWKRKDEVNITQLQRSSSFASQTVLFISASLFYRSRATSQERSSCAITFMHLRLWHWWWSALLGTPSFHSSVDDYNQLPVVYPTSRWIRVIFLMLAQSDFDITLYFFPYYLQDSLCFITSYFKRHMININLIYNIFETVSYQHNSFVVKKQSRITLDYKLVKMRDIIRLIIYVGQLRNNRLYTTTLKWAIGYHMIIIRWNIWDVYVCDVI